MLKNCPITIEIRQIMNYKILKKDLNKYIKKIGKIFNFNGQDDFINTSELLEKKGLRTL